ncbi:Probable 2-oxoglutarate-dependent dioxygenase AOP1.2 [Olea europaea subsp. europaea]|uniref:Probable 2-oxoglutarate-dependent dioxygenase AOP1.2 n=1 Tax=Olea europaea subsp. europaea TaxID=158383 RepID=A0A8S0VGQ1_OLEEU|nr:Probable 2-oxoglutarate-dependent dioxygenase AOP1.2 [Olea europaea subsp. europaea]
MKNPTMAMWGKNPIIALYDYATTLEGAKSFTKLMWPNGNDSFCESSMSFARTVAELERIVITMLFESYNVEKYTDSHIESTTYLLRKRRGVDQCGVPPIVLRSHGWRCMQGMKQRPGAFSESQSDNEHEWKRN